MKSTSSAVRAALCLAYPFSSLLHAGYVQNLDSVPSNSSAKVTLKWSAEPGAIGYTIRRSNQPAGAATFTASVSATDTTWTDAAPVAGATAYYVVEPQGVVGAPSLIERAARPAVIHDDMSVPITDRTGTWSTSTLTGSFGGRSVYASGTSSTTATATFTFRPTVSWAGQHDVYMRWPAHVNRATNTPVQIQFALGQIYTRTVDQQVNGGEWVLLTTLPFDPASGATITVSNAATNGIVGADAVQLVPRPDPMTGYTIPTLEDNFSGTAYDTNLWKIFDSARRPNVSVANGSLALTLKPKAAGVDLSQGDNWLSGALTTKTFLQKYGYYEVRYRVTQSHGVDNAFWLNTPIGNLHYDDYEIDTPEVFTRNTVDANGNTLTNFFSVGVADHRPASNPKRPTDRAQAAFYEKFYQNDFPVNWTEQHVWGLEWRTDNTLVCYHDGELFATSPYSQKPVNGVDYTDAMLPLAPILSTLAVSWLYPSAALEDEQMKVDYIRIFQKPGWLGTVDGSWSDARNWGLDGVPGTNFAAVFNRPTTRTTITCSSDTPVKSLYFDSDSLPSLTIAGPGRLLLGASVELLANGLGGVTVNSEVATSQTVSAPILAQRELQFANMSKNDGVTLTISGAVNGDPANPAPDLQIVGYEKIEFTQPLGARLGSLVKYGPGDYVTSANSAYAGPTLLVNGRTLVTDLSSGGQPSSLGNASSAPANLVFTPRFKHTDENYRPALVYSGPAATCDRGFTLADAADAIIESSGTGALTLTGAVVLKPGATYTPTLTLGGSNTAANTFAVTIDPVNSSTTKLNVTKRDAGSWALGTAWLQTGSLTIDGGAYDLNGFNSTQGAVVVNAGALRNSAANAAQLDCASFNLKTGATLQLHADYSAGTVSADRVKATGTVTLAGSLVFVPGSSLPVGAKVTLVESAGSALIVGTFAGRAEGSTFTASGQSWKITYRGGTGSNDVVLTRML